jgi:hypothetical protein
MSEHSTHNNNEWSGIACAPADLTDNSMHVGAMSALEHIFPLTPAPGSSPGQALSRKGRGGALAARWQARCRLRRCVPDREPLQ